MLSLLVDLLFILRFQLNISICENVLTLCISSSLFSLISIFIGISGNDLKTDLSFGILRSSFLQVVNLPKIRNTIEYIATAAVQSYVANESFKYLLKL